MDKNERKVMFVCDKTKECCTSPSCGTLCRHTANPDHVWGIATEFITDEEIDALKKGKRLYMSVNDEYAVVIKYKKGKCKSDE